LCFPVSWVAKDDAKLLVLIVSRYRSIRHETKKAAEILAAFLICVEETNF